jgi:hypothetical protein
MIILLNTTKKMNNMIIINNTIFNVNNIKLFLSFLEYQNII